MPCSLELDAVLRAHEPPAIRRVLIVLVVAGAGFGTVMGSYGGQPLQALYSAVKVPILIAVSTALCVPSLFAANLVLGLSRDFDRVLRAVVAAQGVVAVALLSLAPLVALFYVSVREYEAAKLLLGGLFLIASLAGQVRLAEQYRVLIDRDARHVWGRRLWLLLYVVVTIQMAWVLRPFIGHPDLATRFFREDSWGNAYLHVLEAARRVLGG